MTVASTLPPELRGDWRKGEGLLARDRVLEISGRRLARFVAMLAQIEMRRAHIRDRIAASAKDRLVARRVEPRLPRHFLVRQHGSSAVSCAAFDQDEREPCVQQGLLRIRQHLSEEILLTGVIFEFAKDTGRILGVPAPDATLVLTLACCGIEFLRHDRQNLPAPRAK